jgi:hypothetical protein
VPATRERSLGDDDDREQPARGVARARIFSQTLVMSYGISGMRMTSAVPATPACSAMNPASRPITSITITRS